MTLSGCVSAGTSTSSITLPSGVSSRRCSSPRICCGAVQRVNSVERARLGSNVFQRDGKLVVNSNGSSFNGTVRIPLAPAVRVQQHGRRSLEVSAMAKREEQLVEIRQMSDQDIETKVVDLKGELFVLRCKQATRQEYQSSDFRKIRKQIARMLTVRREREIEKGIGLRESRKLDREWKKNIVVRPPASLAAMNK